MRDPSSVYMAVTVPFMVDGSGQAAIASSITIIPLITDIPHAPLYMLTIAIIIEHMEGGEGDGTALFKYPDF